MKEELIEKTRNIFSVIAKSLKRVFGRKDTSILFKRKGKEKIIYGVVFVLFLIYALGILYVYFFAFNASLKNGGRAFMRDMVSLSSPPKWENYIDAFSLLTIGKTTYPIMIWNSVWYSVIGSVLGLATVTLSTYVISRYQFPGRNFIYNMVIFIMILPIMGSGPANYRLMAQLGFIESPLILLRSIDGLLDLILFAYFKAIPWEYAEAAMVDGASHWKIFSKIMLPQVLPGLSVLFVQAVIGRWNAYEGPLLYLGNNYPTLAVGIYKFESQIKYAANQPAFFAGALLAAIPPIVLYVLIQNTLMTKIFVGGLKG